MNTTATLLGGSGTQVRFNIRVTCYLVDAAGARVGQPVSTVHPCGVPARIEERAPRDGLRMVYELSL